MYHTLLLAQALIARIRHDEDAGCLDLIAERLAPLGFAWNASTPTAFQSGPGAATPPLSASRAIPIFADGPLDKWVRSLRAEIRDGTSMAAAPPT
jgi:hypothetical protein